MPPNSPSDDNPQINNPQSVTLPPYAEDILKLMFAAFQRLEIKAEFGGGLSDSRVFLVRPIRADGLPELPAVVKMAPHDLITQEWQAYQDCIQRRWPSIAEIAGEPVLPPRSAWGGLRYPLVGDDQSFEVESLHHYCRQAKIKDIRYILEGRLFQIIKQTWQFSQPAPGFNFRASYDRVLPVNLLIKPTPPPEGRPIHELSPDTLSNQLTAQGDYVRVSGFIVTEIDLDGRSVTLNLPPKVDNPPDFYRLRLQPVETVEDYQVNETMDPITGMVTATRHDLLQVEVERIRSLDFHLLSDRITLPDGATLPSPLTSLPAVLNQSRDVKIACIHGDLNLENILVKHDSRNLDIQLIDFAAARRDHVLHDLLRLEAEVVTKLLPEALVKAGLLAETIFPFYEQAHCATHHAGRLGSVNLFIVSLKIAHVTRKNPLLTLQTICRMGALQKCFAILVTIRSMARNYLFSPADWPEYYAGLTIYLLGTLKFRNLDQAPEAPLPKQVAFLGAATAQKLAQTSPICKTISPRSKVAAIVVAIVLILGLIMGALRLLDQLPEDPLAAIIGFRPIVEVKPKGSDRLKEARFNMGLYRGDLVITQDDGAASIICHNGFVYKLGAQSTLTIDCEDATDEHMIGQLDPTFSDQLLRGLAPVTYTLASERTRATRAEQAQTPLLLSPRNTAITDTQPTFHWQPVADAGGYQLSLNLLNGEAWHKETTDTSLPYPADVPPLLPGSTSIVTLKTLDNENTADKSSLRVLDEASLTELAEAEAAIRAIGLDEATQAYLLAQLYQQWELWAAAIAQLERLTAMPEIAPAEVWQQLGDLYFRIELYAPAEANYMKALAAAEAEADQSAQATAYISLARVAHAFEEPDQTLDYLRTAESLYREIGELERAETVAAERAKIEK